MRSRWNAHSAETAVRYNATPAINAVLRCRTRPLALPLERRQECRTRRRLLLIDGVQHDADAQIVAHDPEQIDRVLAAEQADHVGPNLAADFVVAQQRAAERDQRGVLLGEARDGTVVLHDVDDGLLETLPQA